LKVAVVGLGKLGLPLAALLAVSGNEVHGFDLSSSQQDLIKSGEFDFKEPRLNEFLLKSEESLLISDSISEAIKEVELVFVIVPTPSLPSGEFSNEFVVDALNEIGAAIRGSTNKIVIDIVSTVMPNSCEGELSAALEMSSGRKIGKDLGLCYNPEFIALGSVIHDMEYPDMHLIGQSAEWAGALVESALKTITRREVPARRMSLTEAELVKIAVNNFVTMKISYANMLYQAALTLDDVNIDTVTNAIGLDSRIGTKYLRAAAPYGGPCFPRDTRALSFLYSELGLADSLSQATDSANKNHATFIAKYIKQNTHHNAKIGICGISYKTGTQVIEESPGMAIGLLLAKEGNEIRFWDDEEATPLDAEIDFHPENSAESLVSCVDFVVITRPLNDAKAFYEVLEKFKKPYLDLWRQG
jgi:UDPglucose 6-dehydrogenase